MALASDLLRGYTDTIILNRLSRGDSYGYEINKRIAELSGGVLELKEATLYTAFRRLENGGLIISYWGNEDTGARRRYYSLTPSGRDRLAEDLAAWKESRKALDALLEETDGPSVFENDWEPDIPMIRVEE